MQIEQATDQDVLNEMDAAGEARLYRAMRHFWHPVMYASQLGEDPKQVFLLGEQLVLVRMAGEVRCFADLCVHRGTALSVGWVEDDQIRCAYHGWTYGPDGICTSIPARFGTNIPRRARLKPYHVAESSGFIWVCLEDEPRLPIPEFPIYGDPRYRIIEVEPYEWGTSAHRRIENYVDVSHFAWVHDGVLGDHNKPEIRDHEVTRSETEISFEYPDQVESPDIGKNQGLEADDTDTVRSVLGYRLFIPGTVIIEQTLPGNHYYALFFGTSPVSDKKTRCFTLMARDYMLDDLEVGDRTMLDYNDLVIGQDQPVVESQRPEQLPYDLSAELHIRGVDRVSLEYRKALVDLTNELVA
jgi:phenylpropionate dioxygenase-like ring-hydroxylating dioxygenase large terminal subunit